VKGKWFIIAFAVVMTIFVLNSIAAALTFDFVGNDAKKWFDELVNGKTTEIGGADAGWHLTADGLTTNNDVVSGHDRIGIAEDWTDYTLESQYQYLKFGAHKEAHLYVRWNDQADNYFFRTIGRNNGGAVGPWSIEWLRKVGGTDNEGDITDNVKILGDLKEKTLYGLRGEIKDQTLTVDFFNGKEWLPAGEVEYPGTFKKGGIGVGRSSAEIAFQYLRVNGKGIAPDATPVEALGKLATTWGRLKRW
jgi:hypothetical protein